MEDDEDTIPVVSAAVVGGRPAPFSRLAGLWEREILDEDVPVANPTTVKAARLRTETEAALASLAKPVAPAPVAGAAAPSPATAGSAPTPVRASARARTSTGRAPHTTSGARARHVVSPEQGDDGVARVLDFEPSARPGEPSSQCDGFGEDSDGEYVYTYPRPRPSGKVAVPAAPFVPAPQSQCRAAREHARIGGVVGLQAAPVPAPLAVLPELARFEERVFGRACRRRKDSAAPPFQCPEFLQSEYVGIRKGGLDDQRFQASVREALRTAHWFEHQQGSAFGGPTLFPAVCETSRLGPPKVLEVLIVRWVVLGAGYVAGARNAIVAYERWFQSVRDECVPAADGGEAMPYPPDVGLVTYHLVSQTNEARSNHAKREAARAAKGGASRAWRATSAKMRRAGLRNAITAFGAPFTETMLDDRAVRMAVQPPRDVEPLVAKRAQFPPDFANYVEWVAEFPHNVSPVAAELARYVSIAMWSSLRAIEVAGSTVVSVEQDSAAGRDGARHDVVTLRCSGAKGQNAKLHLPFLYTTSTEHTMVGGRRDWLAAFCEARKGWPSLLPRVHAPEGADILARGIHGSPVGKDVAIYNGLSTSYPYEAGGAATLSTAVHLLARTFGYSEDTISDLGITGHGPRHWVADLGRAFQFPVELINELGRWSESQLAGLFIAMGQEAVLKAADPKAALASALEPAESAPRTSVPRIFRGTSAGRCMGKRYSDGSASKARELHVRGLAAHLVQARLAWCDMTPDHADDTLVRSASGAPSPFAQLALRPGHVPRDVSLPALSDEDGSGRATPGDEAPGDGDAETPEVREDEPAGDAPQLVGLEMRYDPNLDGDTTELSSPHALSSDSEYEAPASDTVRSDRVLRAPPASQGAGDAGGTVLAPATPEQEQPADEEAGPLYPTFDLRHAISRDTACQACQLRNKHAQMLLCSECARGWHVWCAGRTRMPPANRPWFCDQCKEANKVAGWDADDYLPLSQPEGRAALTKPDKRSAAKAKRSAAKRSKRA